MAQVQLVKLKAAVTQFRSLKWPIMATSLLFKVATFSGNRGACQIDAELFPVYARGWYDLKSTFLRRLGGERFSFLCQIFLSISRTEMNPRRTDRPDAHCTRLHYCYKTLPNQRKIADYTEPQTTQNYPNLQKTMTLTLGLHQPRVENWLVEVALQWTIINKNFVDNICAIIESWLVVSEVTWLFVHMVFSCTVCLSVCGLS